jgi:arylsulfatase
MEHIDQFGGPEAYNHFAVGWAHAMNTPYQWTKQVASHWGGTRNGAIVHWPHGIRSTNETRTQFHHLIDVAATVLEAANLPAPLIVNSVQQMPLHGVSMAYSFDDADAPERHTTQYFEMFVNRGIYHKGWTAVTRHSIPWVVGKLPAFDDDVWELYGPDDWTQAHNLAAQHPQKLAELQRLFLIEAVKYNVLPLDDRRVERFNSDMAGRPTLIRGKSQLIFGGAQRLSESCTLNIKNKSHAVTADVTVPAGRAEGVIIAQGGAFGGWSLYAKEGKFQYCYNFAGLEHFYVRSEQPIPAGKRQLRMEFAYDGGGLG